MALASRPLALRARTPRELGGRATHKCVVRCVALRYGPIHAIYCLLTSNFYLLTSGLSMELLFLGSGTSYGVPMIGCDCDVCTSDDPRNTRTRASALVQTDGGAILLDSSTELRMQALREGVGHIDAVLYTHSHADHLHGIDDLRSFSGRSRQAIPTYGDAQTIGFIQTNYAYIFNDSAMRLGWGIPRLELHVADAPFDLCGVRVTPVPIMHGSRTILGYRIGDLAYLTDCSGIPESSFPLLQGLHTLILDGLRPEPHPTHFHIAAALDAIARINPKQAYLTHLTHNIDHAPMESTLPDGVRLAYDGLRVDVPE
jgi:phosphoribosyl 1,2-cyclic phosphate phosphodiesterase